MRNKMIVTAAGLCLLGTSALAQPPADQPAGGGGGIGFNVQAQRDKQNKKMEPPTLNLKSEETATWPMIATILFIGACVLVAIIPPKRGHQD